LALTIGAVQAFAFGLPLLVFPASILTLSGLTLPDEGIAIARGAGATVVGLGVIDWMLRNATGDALRALLGGNLVVQGLSLIVNAGEVLAGHLPIQAASASLVHAILGAMFVLALLREARSAEPQRGRGAASG
jgi:hypothetical protein